MAADPHAIQIAGATNVNLDAVEARVAPIPEMSMQDAKSLLKGTNAFFASATLAAIASLATLASAVSIIDPDHVAQQRYLIASAFFLLWQTIATAKTLRDRFYSENQELVQAINGVEWLKGTTEWYISILSGTIAAVVMTCHAISTLSNVSGINKFCLLLNIGFVITSSATFCKTIRDRQDAERDDDAYMRLTVENVQFLARGTRGNVAMVLISFAFSMISTLIIIFLLDLNLAERGFMIMGHLFQSIACMYLSKTVRDSANPNTNPPVQIKDFLLAGTGMLVAVVFTYSGLVAFKMQSITRMCLAIGLVYSLFSSALLSKLVRDHAELKESVLTTLCTCPG